MKIKINVLHLAWITSVTEMDGGLLSAIAWYNDPC